MRSDWRNPAPWLSQDGLTLALTRTDSRQQPATIMIARSPSSALAIIKELRARGPFTHKVLGATVLKDAVVIIIFTAAISLSVVLVEGAEFDTIILLFVVFEILLDIGLGIMIGVWAVIVLTAVSQGASDQVQKQIESLDPGIGVCDIILTPNPKYVEPYPAAKEIWGQTITLRNIYKWL